ncbi:MAG TPA: urea amidolyase associated protein UAAP1 [Acidimicrobiales bacterium]|nr:urea amidolyase associated protein UAAP1 [Acidimicrobiales bacterium]
MPSADNDRLGAPSAVAGPATATPQGAREHARAQAGVSVVGMPTLPASSATGLPPGLATDVVVWDEVLEAGEYAAHRLPRGAVLRLTDLAGDACAHLVVHHADLPSERLNLADTTKVQWQMYPTTGSLLLSDRGRALLAFVGDTSGRHDTICGAPNGKTHLAKYGSGSVEGSFPNGRDRLIVALAKFGLERRDLPPSISLFKGVRVDGNGALRLDPAPAPPGTYVELRAELAVIVSVANVPHALDHRPGYVCTPLRLTAWRGSPTAPDDPLRSVSPEAERAYLNTDDWLAGH